MPRNGGDDRSSPAQQGRGTAEGSGGGNSERRAHDRPLHHAPHGPPPPSLRDGGGTAQPGREDHPPPLDPRRHALFLDFDGTFVDFAPEPHLIRLRPGSAEILRQASQKLGGALALVSGRKVADLDHFLAPLELPASGVHGQEFRPVPGDLRLTPPTPQLDEARRRLAAALLPDDPLLLEDKGGALVLHFRKHPQQRGRAEILARTAAAGLEDLHVVEGHAIFEIRQRGISKATALGLFASLPPFAGRRPVFVGDDTTDEDGFRAAAQAGGFGVKVGPGETCAACRLPDVSAVHRWLADIAESTPSAWGTGPTKSR